MHIRTSGECIQDVLLPVAELRCRLRTRFLFCAGAPEVQDVFYVAPNSSERPDIFREFFLQPGTSKVLPHRTNERQRSCAQERSANTSM